MIDFVLFISIKSIDQLKNSCFLVVESKLQIKKLSLDYVIIRVIVCDGKKMINQISVL